MVVEPQSEAFPSDWAGDPDLGRTDTLQRLTLSGRSGDGVAASASAGAVAEGEEGASTDLLGRAL